MHIGKFQNGVAALSLSESRSSTALFTFHLSEALKYTEYVSVASL